MAIKHAHKNKKVLIGVVLVVLLATTGGIVWFINRKTHQSTATTQDYKSPEPGGINLDPPTEEDKQDVDKNKDRLGGEEASPTQPSGSAAVVITRAEQLSSVIEVSSYVSNVFEDDGTCTLTLKSGSRTVTKETLGMRDARNTICPTFSVPRSELPAAGSWTAVVSYSSPKAKGSSEGKVFTVQ